MTPTDYTRKTSSEQQFDDGDKMVTTEYYRGDDLIFRETEFVRYDKPPEPLTIVTRLTDEDIENLPDVR